MSSFKPTSRTVWPSATPEELAQSVVHSLARPLGIYHRASVVRGVVTSLLTFGIWPLLKWPLLFRDFVNAEQQQLWHLAQWLKLQTPREEAVELVKRAQRLRARWWLDAVSLCALGWLAASAYSILGNSAAPRLLQLLEGTWGYFESSVPHGSFASILGRHSFLSAAEARALFYKWNVCLAVAYLLHWMQVQLHAEDMRRFVGCFNRLAHYERFAPISPAPSRTGISLVWSGAGVALAVLGGLWGIPMALAGGAHNQYIRLTSAKNRASLAGRVREMLLNRRPPLDVPTPVYLMKLCARRGCRAELPAIALFCPRCGAAAAAAPAEHIDRLV